MSTSDERESEPKAEESAAQTRRFGWWDIFVHSDDDPRTDGGFHGER